MRVDQSQPIWERPSNPRGHTSSVERALQAHRDQVSARSNRTEARLVGAATPTDQFFVNPARAAATKFSPSDRMTDTEMVESPSVSIQPADDATESQASPMMAMDDLYESLSTSPVRSLAPRLVANESVESIADIQSDDVPEGSTINHYA